MPFDGTNFQKTTTHPSLDGLIEWLETQDPNTTYDYKNNKDCLFCRYLRSVGFPLQSMGGYHWTDEDKKHHDLPRNMVYVPVLYNTYGEALQKAYRVREEKTNHAL